MKDFVYRFLVILILILGILFTIYNNHDVMVYMLYFGEAHLALYKIVLISFVCGVLVAFLLLLPSLYSKHRKYKKQVKENKKILKDQAKNK